MSFFDWFKKSPKANTNISKVSSAHKGDDEAYALEWRNRYLEARVKYLKTKIEEKGGSITLDTPLDDAKAENERLAGLVSKLETWLGEIQGE